MLIVTKHRHLPRVEKKGCTHTHTHARTHNTTQSEHLYYTCIHDIVHVHMYLCGRFNSQAALQSCQLVEELRRALGLKCQLQSIIYLSCLQSTCSTSMRHQLHCTHVDTCTNIIPTYHIQWYNVHCKYVEGAPIQYMCCIHVQCIYRYVLYSTVLCRGD